MVNVVIEMQSLVKVMSLQYSESQQLLAYVFVAHSLSTLQTLIL